MAWIEVHQSLPGHKKTMACAEELGVSEVQMVGHLVVFWLWAIDNSTDGSLPGVTPRMLAKAAKWDGDCHALCNALCNAGFLHQRDDNVYVIHDWDDYAGKLIAKREANRERQRRHRERKSAAKPTDEEEHNALRNGDITVTSPSCHGATVQYSTVPYSTNTTTTTVDMYTCAPAGTPVESSSDGLEVDEETPEAAWQRLTGQCINPLQSAEIQAFIEDGLQRDAVIWAMERTRLEGKGFNYCRGILKNLRDEGIYSLAQIQTRRRTRTAGIEPPSLRLRRLREEEAQHGDVAGRRTA